MARKFAPTTTVRNNGTAFTDHDVIHADRFRNATAVVNCPGAFSLTENGPCYRCGYPTETVAKVSRG